MSNFVISNELMDKIRDVYAYWGDQMPLNLCEECGELIKSVSKMERSFGLYNQTLSRVMFEPADWLNLDLKHSDILTEPRNDVIKEMGDAIISIFALCERYSISKEDLEKRIKEKLNEKK